MEIAGKSLTVSQLQRLKAIFASGAEDASRCFSKWLRADIALAIDEVEEFPLAQITEILGSGDDLVSACSIALFGRISGRLLIVFTDDTGLALVDSLMDRPPGTSIVWGEVEQSAVQETANILACAYINSLAVHMPDSEIRGELLPSPPDFVQDYAASLLESLFVGQAVHSDNMIVIRTAFRRDQTEHAWHMLFVPDFESLNCLVDSLSDT